MKSYSLLASLCAVLLFNGAVAGTIQIGGDGGGPNGKFTTKVGVCTIDFDGSTCSMVTESGNSASNIVSGSVTGQYAAPAGDSSRYLTVSPAAGSPITFVMSEQANYFGFFAGSLDSFNLVRFFLGATQVDSFNGTQINAVAFPGAATTGNQAQAQFIDYFPTSAYDRVIISSTSNAFELDNLAIGIATPTAVPEPETLALLGLGLLACVTARRRKD